jgi:class 3 adenylate cyclase
MGERGIAQACDLAGAAQPGQVLVSSQLGSLLQVAQIEPAARLRSTRVKLLNGRTAAAYVVDPPRGAPAGAVA